MKKTFRTLALLIAAILICTCFAACKKDEKNPDTSSLQSTVTSDSTQGSKPVDTDISSDETVTSSEPETSSSEPTTSSEKPVSSAPKPSTPSSTPKPSSTPSTPSKPQTPAKKTPKELIIGKWKGVYDCGPEFENMGYEIAGEYKVNTTMEFTTSGSFIETFNTEDFKRVCKPIILQELENQRIENNITPEELEASIQTNFGMTLDEYIDATLEEIIVFMNIVTEYKFADDTLLVKDPNSSTFIECEYEFTNDNTLVTIEGNNRTTYTRVS